SGNPDRALPHARSLARIAPYDEQARATLVRLLLALGNIEQAEQQYEAGTRMLREAGVASSGELLRAWRGAPRAPAVNHPGPARLGANGNEHGTVIAPTFGLIGREAEVACIKKMLVQTITQRRDAFVLVHGEPGIGKSRLLETVATLARDAGALL